MTPDDRTLWNRASTGDDDAFAALFERHAKLIYNFCFRRVGNWSTAEDLVSVVFLEAWRRRRADFPPEKVLPWLFGIATNVVHNRRRSERRYAAALARVPRPQVEPAFTDDVDARIDDERRMKRALAALSELPRHAQDAYVLCAWFDLSYEDAALALDVPIGTVRSRLSRARKRLQAGSDFGDDENRTEVAKEAFGS